MSGLPTANPRHRVLFVAANPSIDRLYEIDRVTAGAIHRPQSMVSVAGGKGLNAARAAASLGGSVIAVGIVGGRAGDWIVERLAELGIDARMVHSRGETRTCVSVLDRSTGDLTEIYEHGAQIETANWEALESLVQAEMTVGDVAVLAVSGSLPPGAPPDGYGRIARIAARTAPTVPLVVDAAASALAAVLGEAPAVVKLNASEASDVSGVRVAGALSAVTAAGIIRSAGAGTAIVTIGLAGAVVVSEDQQILLSPPAIRGSYPVGSGDAFLGGLAVAMARGELVVAAARHGLAAGIANAQVPGAGTLDPGTIGPLLDRIAQTPI